MYTLNEKISGLTPYNPLSERYNIRLDANESCFNLSKEILEELHKKLDTIDFNRYPDPNCTNLSKAFAQYYNIDYKNVTVGNGSDELISVILASFLMKGQKIATIEPDFSMYRFYASLSELEYVSIKKENDLTLNIEKVISNIIDQNINAIIFSNPCNPTSKGFTKADVEKLITSVDALVILDEAYMDFWDNSLIQEVNKYDNLIILRTASKAVGSAALRLGFAIANEKISFAIKAVKSPYNVNTVSQVFGEIIYKNKEYLENNRKMIVSLRETLYNDIKELESKFPNKIETINGKSNFIFIKTKYAEKIHSVMLENSISIRLMGDYIRVSTGKKDENTAFVELFKSILNSI